MKKTGQKAYKLSGASDRLVGDNGFTWVRAWLATISAVVMLTVMAVTLSYPVRIHRAPILSACSEFSVRVSLVRAVILCESGYRATVVSRAGAVGLMQLMPETARHCAQKLGMTDYDEEMLTDPNVNIRLGTYYLSYLLERFDRECDALAAYNAGEGNVRIWLDAELDTIPFLETRMYVERVQKAAARYERLL